MIESLISFQSHPARPNLVNKYFIISDQFGGKIAYSFNARGRTLLLQGRKAFFGPVRANAYVYSLHTGLSSIVLQSKGSQGRTGHMMI